MGFPSTAILLHLCDRRCSSVSQTVFAGLWHPCCKCKCLAACPAASCTLLHDKLAAQHPHTMCLKTVHIIKFHCFTLHQQLKCPARCMMMPSSCCACSKHAFGIDDCSLDGCFFDHGGCCGGHLTCLSKPASMSCQGREHVIDMK